LPKVIFFAVIPNDVTDYHLKFLNPVELANDNDLKCLGNFQKCEKTFNYRT